MPKKNDVFEKKDRIYQVRGLDGRDAFPISYELNVRSSEKNPLIYNEDGENKPIRYCINQKTPFEDEQKGQSQLGRVVFFNGRLVVDKNNIVLQKLLSLYHPHKGIKYYEIDPEAQNQEEIEKEQNYISVASSILKLKNFELKAIGRQVLGSKSSKMPMSTIKHNLISEAKSNPKSISVIESLIKGEDLSLISLAFSAIDDGLVKVSSKGDKLMNPKDNSLIIEVEFDEDPSDKLVRFLKSKKGVDLKKYLSTKLDN